MKLVQGQRSKNRNQLIELQCKSIQLTGFYMVGTLALIRFTIFTNILSSMD